MNSSKGLLDHLHTSHMLRCEWLISQHLVSKLVSSIRSISNDADESLITKIIYRALIQRSIAILDLFHALKGLLDCHPLYATADKNTR